LIDYTLTLSLVELLWLYIKGNHMKFQALIPTRMKQNYTETEKMEILIMKRFCLLLLVFVFISNAVWAEVVEIPDANLY